MAEEVKRPAGSKSELQLLPARCDLEKDLEITYLSIRKAQTLLGYTQELT